MLKTIEANREQMVQYFLFLEKRFESYKEIEERWECRIAGHKFWMRIKGHDIVEHIEPSLHICQKTATETPDVTFYVWKDSLAECMLKTKEEVEQNTYCCYNLWGSIVSDCENAYLSAYDYEQKRGYLCFQEGQKIKFEHRSHPFRVLFHWWAKSSGYYLLHSAAVGIGESGILISSAGGKGKSTLALGCLADGMDYISDDYLLIRGDGCHEVFPIYSTGYLHLDSLEWLSIFKQYAVASDETRDCKTLVDLNKFEAQIRENMKVKAIVFPVVTNDKQVKIEKMYSTKALMQMALSTISQSWEIEYTEFLRRLLKSVSSLPVYQINLSDNIPENVKAIKQFIKKI